MGRTKDAIAEGLSIATAAARLTVRNRILVETIARGGHFDGEIFAEFARETLRALAAEQDQAADRVTQQRKRAWGRFSDSSGTHDYRDRDTRNLRRRARQSHGVAKELRAFATTPSASTTSSPRPARPRGATSRRTSRSGSTSRA